MKSIEPLLAASRAGDSAGVQKYLPDVQASYAAYMKECDTLYQDNVDFGKSSGAASQKAMSLASTLSIAMTVAGIFFGVLFSWVLVREINRILSKVSNTLDDGAKQVSSAAGQISGASQSLAEGASEQAASLEETSASLEEMSSMTRNNAENAKKANDLAKQAHASANRGASDMQAMSGAMEAIKTSSDDIAKIIKTIDEIAFQTNILALNAAVEAARAGEAGMGFAVVADEVRNLAQRSAQAAKETAGKIEGAIAKTAQGVQISGKVAEALTDIVNKARQVDELVSQVASASREQSQGINQINTAVSQMDKVTQSSAASAEESAAAAQELSAQSLAMKESVNELLKLAGALKTSDDQEHSLSVPSATRPHGGPVVPARPGRPMKSIESPQAPPGIPMPEDGASKPARGVIVWNASEMATGDDTIDSQHQVLIDRINELHAACVAGTAREDLMKLLDFLGEYAQSHFRHEEEVMQTHRCPVRGKNKAAHIQFLEDYEKLVETVKKNGPSTAAVLQIKELLGNWLKNHICAIDTNLRSCNGYATRQTAGSAEGVFRDF